MMKKIAIAIMLYSSVAVAHDARKYEIIGNLLSVAKEAHEMFASDIPFSMPYIDITDIDPVEGKHCGGKCPKEYIIAGYYNNGVVYLNNKLDWLNNEEHKAIFVHEMVHYFQDQKKVLNDVNKAACSNRKDMEKQAFKVQSQYLSKRGLSFNEAEVENLVKVSTKAVCNPD